MWSWLPRESLFIFLVTNTDYVWGRGRAYGHADPALDRWLGGQARSKQQNILALIQEHVADRLHVRALDVVRHGLAALREGVGRHRSYLSRRHQVA